MEITWTVLNSHVQSAKIINFKSWSGNTAPYFSKDEIMPGDTFQVKLMINTRGRKGRFQTGGSLNIGLLEDSIWIPDTMIILRMQGEIVHYGVMDSIFIRE